MSRVGIIGAGAAAGSLTYLVDRTVPDAEITVLEKSRGLCGRAATRRRDAVTYDYGANYLKDDDDRVVELVTETLDSDGLVDVTEPIYTFSADGEVSPGRDADEHKWTYRRGITQLAKRLLGNTDAIVHRETRVETIRRVDESWKLVDGAGTEWGPFDVVVANPPAPQTAALLDDADWGADARDELYTVVDDVPYLTNYTAVLHYPFELEKPYYALVNTDKEHDVGWIAREECKPGHVPEGESLLIVQANHEWASTHYEDSPAKNVSTLAEQAADIMNDDRLTDPDWTDHQGWRYALPERGPPRGSLRKAEQHGFYCVGDWVAGEARLHAAVRNGLETGERLAFALGT